MKRIFLYLIAIVCVSLTPVLFVITIDELSRTYVPVSTQLYVEANRRSGSAVEAPAPMPTLSQRIKTWLRADAAWLAEAVSLDNILPLPRGSVTP